MVLLYPSWFSVYMFYQLSIEGVKISNYNCRFADISSKFYQLSGHIWQLCCLMHLRLWNLPSGLILLSYDTSLSLVIFFALKSINTAIPVFLCLMFVWCSFIFNDISTEYYSVANLFFFTKTIFVLCWVFIVVCGLS